MKNILTSAINKEIILVSLAVTATLMIVFIAGDIAYYLALAAAGKLNITTVMLIISLNAPLVASEFIPLSALLAVLLVFGRMAQDSELVVLLASGIGYQKIYQMVLKLGLIVAVILTVITLYTFPLMKHKLAELKYNISTGVALENLKSGKFYELAGGNRVIYAETIKDGVMHNVFLQIVANNTRYLLRAKSGKIELDSAGNKMLSLYDGSRYSNNGTGLQYSITHYQKHSIILTTKPKPNLGSDAAVASTWSLLNQLNSKHAQVEIQWRLSIPLMTIIMMLVGVALSKHRPRVDKYSKILPGILLYFLYFNFINISKHQIITDEINVLPGLWLVHFGFAIVATFLIWQTLKPLKKTS